MMLLVLLMAISSFMNSVAILETVHGSEQLSMVLPKNQQPQGHHPFDSGPPQPEKFRHRRLHQEEREGDAARGGAIDQQGQQQHVTSYAQRHQNYYYSSGGGNNNNNGRSSNSNNAYGSSSYYNYDDDYAVGAKTGVHRRYHHNYDTSRSEFYTDLSDVWLCLLTALAWAVWMISSFVASKQAAGAAASYNSYYDADDDHHAGYLSAVDTARFLNYYDPHKRDTVLLVRGHVREVSRTDFGYCDDSHNGNNNSEGPNDGDMSGFPTYTAVIDYMIESEQTHESIQIRKHFETQQFLEQGFANVELLVLPEEPKHSILKEDFDQKIQEERRVKQLEQERRSRRNDGLSDADDTNNTEAAKNNSYDPLGDILEGRYCNQKWKRVSTGVAAVLVLASLAGTVQVVCLMDPEVRWQGWVSVCVGVTVLLPVALLVHKCLLAFARWQALEPEKQGYIVQSYTATGTIVTNNNNNNTTTKAATILSGNDNNRAATTTLMQECCLMPPSCGGLLDEICDQPVTDGGSRSNSNNTSKFPYAEAASYVVPEMSGCYFVHYPTNDKMNNNSDNSSRHMSRSRASNRSPSSHYHHLSEGQETTILSGPVVSTIHEAPSPSNNISALNHEISSTSSVSSISDDDPTMPASTKNTGIRWAVANGGSM